MLYRERELLSSIYREVGLIYFQRTKDCYAVHSRIIIVKQLILWHTLLRLDLVLDMQPMMDFVLFACCIMSRFDFWVKNNYYCMYTFTISLLAGSIPFLDFLANGNKRSYPTTTLWTTAVV